jgi:hypothetical protein
LALSPKSKRKIKESSQAEVKPTAPNEEPLIICDRSELAEIVASVDYSAVILPDNGRKKSG